MSGKFQPAPWSVGVASHASEFPGWLHLFGVFVDTPVNLLLILSGIGDTPQIIIESLCDSCLMKLFFLLNDAKEAAFISAWMKEALVTWAAAHSVRKASR